MQLSIGINWLLHEMFTLLIYTQQEHRILLHIVTLLQVGMTWVVWRALTRLTKTRRV
jgi:hypothetical protein